MFLMRRVFPEERIGRAGWVPQSVQETWALTVLQARFLIYRPKIYDSNIFEIMIMQEIPRSGIIQAPTRSREINKILAIILDFR